MSDKHTPTPWTNDGYGSLNGPDGKTITVWGLGIAHGQRSANTEANARHIVHCVNYHAELVEALRLAMDFIDKSPSDPDITNEQVAAWMALCNAEPRELLAKLDVDS